MKNIKKIIIVLIFIIITISSILLIIDSNNKDSKERIENEKDLFQNGGNQIAISSEVSLVKNHTMYFTVSDCVQKYLNYISINLEETTKSNNNIEYVEESFAESEGILTEDEKKQAIYNILDKEYIKNNQISTSNIYEYVERMDGKLKFKAIKMNVLDGERIKKYSVYGKIVDTMGNSQDYNAYFIVTIDDNNTTFMIEPLQSDRYSDLNEILIKKDVDSIEKNDNNTFVYNRLKNEDIAFKYFSDYKMKSLSEIEEAYELLDKEYREKRFKTLDNYKKYIQDNKVEYSSSTIFEYSVNTYNDYTEYVCKDKYGNLYIFKETAVMQYTLTLDTYTLENEKFTTTYEQSNDQKKVMMNVDKFFQMLNARDYKTSYEILDSGFKNNYFNTQEVYENYMRSAFPDHYKVEYTGFSNEGNILIQKVKLTSMENNTTMEKNIIMKLEEGTKFVMSFNIQ